MATKKSCLMYLDSFRSISKHSPPPPPPPLKFWEIRKEPSLNLVEYVDEFLGLRRRQNKKKLFHNGKSLPSSTQELHNWLDVCVALSLVSLLHDLGWWRNNVRIQQSFLRWLLGMHQSAIHQLLSLSLVTVPEVFVKVISALFSPLF